jgi:hypothetical protein
MRFITDDEIAELAERPGWDWHSAYYHLLRSREYEARMGLQIPSQALEADHGQ